MQRLVMPDKLIIINALNLISKIKTIERNKFIKIPISKTTILIINKIKIFNSKIRAIIIIFIITTSIINIKITIITIKITKSTKLNV